MRIIPETDNVLEEMIEFLSNNQDIMNIILMAITTIQQREIEKFSNLEKQPES